MDNILMKDVSPNGGYLFQSTAGNWDDEFLSDDSLSEAVSLSSSVGPQGLAEVVEVAGNASPGTVITITVVALLVVVAIVGLFALAIFIDYRQQKMVDQNKQNASTKRKRYPRMNFPRCRKARDGDTSIIADAELPGLSRTPLETIVEVV